MYFERVRTEEMKYRDRKPTFDTMESSTENEFYEGHRRKI